MITAKKLGEWLIKQGDKPVLTPGDFNGDAWELESFYISKAVKNPYDIDNENWILDFPEVDLDENLEREEVVFLYG